MGVGQPRMERDQRRLQTESRDKQAQGKTHAGIHATLLNRAGDVGHIQGTSVAVDQGNPEEDERRADTAQNHVLERRLKLLVLATKTDERVRRNRGNLEKHVEIEDVAGENDAVHARDHEQEQAQVLRLGGVLLHVACAEEHGGRANGCNRQQQQRTETVEDHVDPERNRPPAHLVRLRLADGGHCQSEKADHHQVGQEGRDRLEPPAEGGKHKGRHQRNRHKQGQRYAHPRNLLISVMSNVPYFVYVRMQIEIISASEPRLMTMDVRTRACGSGSTTVARK